MLIRSQDRNKIYNTDTMNEIWINKNCIYISICVDDACLLGTYTTKEKAIKVLDMIEEEYLEPTYISCFSDMEYAKHEHKVFHMPQEDEVVLK